MNVFVKCLLLLSLLAALRLQADLPPSPHTLYDSVLKTHVRKGRVDYKALKASPDTLNAYLDSLANVSRKDYDAWSEDRQLAFLLNLYNATTLKLIIDHYPVDSIKDIGGFFSGPWKQSVVRLWGETLTLNHLEHDIIRVTFKKRPETHFALVCAAEGCPPLRNEPYRADTLKAQLADQRRRFLSNQVKNHRDPKTKTLYLSPIFKWYDKDFKATSGSLQAYLAEDWPGVDSSWRIRYTTYNWELNDVE